MREVSFTALSSTFRSSLNENEDPLTDDFIPVQHNRRSRSKAAKPTTTVPDIHNQFGDQLLYSVATVPKTPHQDATRQAITVPQMQPIYSRVSPEMEENTNRSKREVTDSSNCFSLEDFPLLEGTDSNVKASSAAWCNIKPTDTSMTSCTKPSPPSTSQRLQSDQTSARKPSTEQHSAVSFQDMPGHLGSSMASGPVHSSKTCIYSGHIKSSFSPVTLSQRFQSNINAGVLPASTVPQGVVVACDHFLQENRRRTSSIFVKIKTCKTCDDHGLLKYAVWNYTNCYWQEMRPYPASMVPLRATLDVCRHFATNRPCPKVPCTFPHGRVESAMWEMEREGGEYKLHYEIHVS